MLRELCSEHAYAIAMGAHASKCPAVVDHYIELCRKYNTEANAGVLTFLRFKTRALTPSERFFCKDMLPLADVLLLVRRVCASPLPMAQRSASCACVSLSLLASLSSSLGPLCSLHHAPHTPTASTHCNFTLYHASHPAARAHTHSRPHIRYPHTVTCTAPRRMHASGVPRLFRGETLGQRRYGARCGAAADDMLAPLHPARQCYRRIRGARSGVWASIV